MHNKVFLIAIYCCGTPALVRRRAQRHLGLGPPLPPPLPSVLVASSCHLSRLRNTGTNAVPRVRFFFSCARFGPFTKQVSSSSFNFYKNRTSEIITKPYLPTPRRFTRASTKPYLPTQKSVTHTYHTRRRQLIQQLTDGCF